MAGLYQNSVVFYAEERRATFFDCTVQQRSCLHHLVPPPRDPASYLACLATIKVYIGLHTSSRLTAPSKFPRIPNRTKKYQSFISYGLSKYQTC